MELIVRYKYWILAAVVLLALVYFLYPSSEEGEAEI
mgnify:CR=1 FL=1